jgi:signal transduction histidine kinase
MVHLASLATKPPAAVHGYGTQEAHDLRNLLATPGASPRNPAAFERTKGAKAADAAQAIVERAAALCDVALERGAQPMRLWRQRVDLVQTAREAADLLASLAPEEFSFGIDHKESACVLADPNDAFRILFNLMHNAVAVARRRQECLKSLVVRTEFERSMTTMKLADDGPGLPLDIRARLFGSHPRRLSSNGFS